MRFARHLTRAVAVALLALGMTVARADAQSPAKPVTQASAIFAGGCFWCMEPAFESVKGVTSVTSGYSGGKEINPTYEQVSSGTTGHYESVRVEYDPSQVSYTQLLNTFWHNIDPTDGGGQFCDRGTQYRAAIFYGNEEEKKEAEASKEAIEKSGQLPKPIVTQILPAGPFYPAEEYHQDFYKKNPAHYQAYRYGCGRDRRLETLWGKDAPKHD